MIIYQAIDETQICWDVEELVVIGNSADARQVSMGGDRLWNVIKTESYGDIKLLLVSLDSDKEVQPSDDILSLEIENNGLLSYTFHVNGSVPKIGEVLCDYFQTPHSTLVRAEPNGWQVDEVQQFNANDSSNVYKSICLCQCRQMELANAA
jgi:hypothetical protein